MCRGFFLDCKVTKKKRHGKFFWALIFRKLKKFHFFSYLCKLNMNTKKSPSENVVWIFSNYLKSKGFRQTPERFAILSEIYLSEHYFTMHSLGERLTKKKFFVSRTTLYNTVELLLECGLVRRYELEGKIRFEKTRNVKSHDHLVLTDTKEVLEFSNEQIAKIKKYIENLFDVEIYDHSLTFYGKRRTAESADSIALSEPKKHEKN